MPAIASVAGPRPACGVHHPVPSSGIRLSSPSGVRSAGVVVRDPAVQPSGVHPSSVHPSSVQPSGVRPVRPDMSVWTHTRRWRWGPGRCGGATCTTGMGRGPVGCRVLERLGRRPRRPGRGRRCRGRASVSDRSYAVARRWAGQAFRGTGAGSPWRVMASCQRSLTAPMGSLGSRRSRCSTTKPTRTRATWRTWPDPSSTGRRPARRTAWCRGRSSPRSTCCACGPPPGSGRRPARWWPGTRGCRDGFWSRPTAASRTWARRP
jgi:hypothetical protein